MSGRSRAYFLVKDPHWTFIWWSINPKGEKGTPTLRVHDVTHIIFDGYNSHCYFDVEATGDTDHWYLPIAVSNRNYLVDVGFKDDNGHFSTTARTNTIYLPRDCPSESTQVTWKRIEI